MKYRYLYWMVILLFTVIVGCQHEVPDGFDVDAPQPESGSVVTLNSNRSDGIISLSVDAPAQARFGVWIDLDGDGLRAEDGSEEVKVFNVYQNYTLAADMKTISIYGDITYLSAASNELAAIDLSGNPHLTTLNVPLNNLKAVDLSQNKALERLDISGNELNSLNVSANTALVSLWCFNNKLTAIDVSNNSSLAFLDISGNALRSLDISANAQLKRLLAYNNQLTALDISNNSQLNHLWVFGNQLPGTEMEDIVSNLRSVTNGDLWLSFEPLSEALHASAVEKGWTVQ